MREKPSLFPQGEPQTPEALPRNDRPGFMRACSLGNFLAMINGRPGDIVSVRPGALRDSENQPFERNLTKMTLFLRREFPPICPRKNLETKKAREHSCSCPRAFNQDHFHSGWHRTEGTPGKGDRIQCLEQ